MQRATLRLLLTLVASALPARALLQPYPAPAGLAPSPHYRVEVSQGTGAANQDAPVFVYHSPAQWRTNVSLDTAWAPFAFTGRVTLRVTKLDANFSRVRVLPSHRAIAVAVSGRTVKFSLDRPGQFAVEFDESIAHPLLIFADPPENPADIPARNDPNVRWFAPGVHDLGEKFIEPLAGQTVYLAPGAYVRGRLKATDAPGVRLLGRGILSGENLPPNPPGTYTAPHLADFSGKSDRVRVEGVTLVSSPHYNLLLRGSDCVVRHTKIIGWYYGTDGIGTGPRGLVEDCFIKCNDDALKLYADGMTVRRCTIWQLENGAAFQLSWNLNHDVRGVRVTDCDVIRVEHRGEANNRGIFCSIHGGRGHLRDFLFEDIRIENATWRLALFTTRKSDWSRSETFGDITDITLRRISADGPFAKPSEIKSYEATGRFARFNFEDLRIRGRLIRTAAEANLLSDPATATDIRFTLSR